VFYDDYLQFIVYTFLEHSIFTVPKYNWRCKVRLE